jgi:hypothetical protein
MSVALTPRRFPRKSFGEDAGAPAPGGAPPPHAARKLAFPECLQERELARRLRKGRAPEEHVGIAGQHRPYIARSSHQKIREPVRVHVAEGPCDLSKAVGSLRRHRVLEHGSSARRQGAEAHEDSATRCATPGRQDQVGVAVAVEVAQLPAHVHVAHA